MAIRLPGYRITERLGKGGMAHVFLATQHSFERQVAIKILSPSLALEPSFAERFMQEAAPLPALITRISCRFTMWANTRAIII